MVVRRGPLFDPPTPVPPAVDLPFLVARRIAHLRRRRQLTQERLAQRLGIATKNLQRMEAGGQNLTLRTLQSVALALDVEPAELLRPAGSDVATETGESENAESLRTLGLELFAEEDPRARGLVPVMSLRAAASPPTGSEIPELLGYVRLRGRRRSGRRFFIARVIGSSMEPSIPNLSWCVFRRGPADVGEIALVQHSDIADPDTGASFAVKRLGQVTRRRDESLVIRLESLNRRYRPLTLRVREMDELRVIARLVEVLEPQASD